MNVMGTRANLQIQQRQPGISSVCRQQQMDGWQTPLALHSTFHPSLAPFKPQSQVLPIMKNVWQGR